MPIPAWGSRAWPSIGNSTRLQTKKIEQAEPATGAGNGVDNTVAHRASAPLPAAGEDSRGASAQSNISIGTLRIAIPTSITISLSTLWAIISTLLLIVAWIMNSQQSKYLAFFMHGNGPRNYPMHAMPRRGF